MREASAGLTVLLPVHNGGRYLPAAVHSILTQSLRDFELLIIDDGSTDGSSDYLASLTDPRVRLLRQENRGLVATLNRGFDAARTELVARMDADDVSAPDRLARQVACLRANPDAAGVGSCYDVVGDDGQSRGIFHAAAAPAYLRRQLYRHNPFPHGGMLLRASCVRAVGGYRSDVGPVEDYDLWCRLAARYDLLCDPGVLFAYRITPMSVSTSAARRQWMCFEKVRADLAATAPPPGLSPLRLAAEGRRHVAQFGARCPGAAARYLQDHLFLTRLLWRLGKPHVAGSYALGCLLFLARCPGSGRGLLGDLSSARRGERRAS